MKQKEIIELVQYRTERKAGERFNYNLELLCTLQDFIREKEWDWRFNTGVFDTVQNQNEYNLVSAPIGFKDISDPVTIIRVQDRSKLDEVKDVTNRAKLLDGVTPNTPKQWFKKPGNHDVVVLNTPDGAVQLRVIYDAIPPSLPSDESIPLVPDHLHGLLVDALELKVLKQIFSSESEKFQLAEAKYQEKLSKA